MEDESGRAHGDREGMPQGFVAERLLSSGGAVSTYRAREVQVDRTVTLRLATTDAASALLADARQLAGIHDPGLVAVLAAGNDGGRAYVATGGETARPLSETGGLTDAEAVQVAADVAGAIDALARAGLRSPVSAETVLVETTASGVRGILDPLRSSVHGDSVLSAAEPATSISELAGLIADAVAEPGEDLRRALAEARSGSLSAAALATRLSLAAQAPRTERRFDRRIGLAAFLTLGAVVVALLAWQSGRGGTPSVQAPTIPAGRVVSRVPLGLPADEFPVGIAIVGRTAWIATTAGRLLRVDTAREVVTGTPIGLPGKHPLSGLATYGGSLLTTDYAGWVMRIDPRTGGVTRRRHLAGELDAATLAGNVLWIADSHGGQGGALRLDARTLAPVGRRLPGVPYPRQIVARGSRAWILGGGPWGEVARVDARSGARVIALVGPQVVREALSGDTLWVTDQLNGTVSPLSAEHMSFKREAVHPARVTMGAISVGGDIWVKTTKTLGDTGPEFLERFDGRTGRRLGQPVPVGKNGQALTYVRGSLWVATATTLMRLVPTSAKLTPGGPRTGVSRGSRPRPLVAGPLSAAKWRTSRFEAPFTFSTAALDWLAVYPLHDSLLFHGARTLDVSVSFATPRQFFASDSAPVPIHSPADVLRLLKRNPRLHVVERTKVAIGTQMASRVEISAKNPRRHPEVCGPDPCVFLYPAQYLTATITPGGWHEVLLLQAGRHTVVIGVDGPGDHRAAESAASRFLRTVRFS